MHNTIGYINWFVVCLLLLGLCWYDNRKLHRSVWFPIWGVYVMGSVALCVIDLAYGVK